MYFKKLINLWLISDFFETTSHTCPAFTDAPLVSAGLLADDCFFVNDACLATDLLFAKDACFFVNDGCLATDCFFAAAAEDCFLLNADAFLATDAGFFVVDGCFLAAVDACFLTEAVFCLVTDACFFALLAAFVKDVDFFAESFLSVLLDLATVKVVCLTTDVVLVMLWRFVTEVLLEEELLGLEKMNIYRTWDLRSVHLSA